jgi:lipid-A-disaccharide synthase
METMVDAGQMNVSGFWEVVRRYRFLRGVFRSLVLRAQREPPTLAILVDYPGFNLRAARTLARIGIPIVYYIAPQTWAWKESRVETLRRYVDELIVVFPFEVEYFKRHGLRPHYFGNPMAAEFLAQINAAPKPRDVDERPTIVYLPGSRRQEVERHAPLIRGVIERMGGRYRHVIARASTLTREFLVELFVGCDCEISDAAAGSLAGADAAVVKAGTSTLDATLAGVPFVTIYATSGMSYRISRALIKVPYVAMTNILAGRQVVQEFLQDAMTTDNVLGELKRLLDDKPYRDTMLESFTELRGSLHGEDAAKRAAEFIQERFSLEE